MPGPATRGPAPTPVSTPTRCTPRTWCLFLLLALGLVTLTSGLRLRRVAYVTDVAGRTEAELATGGGRPDPRPQLIVPGRHSESFEQLALAREMLSRREWRLRHIDYENAPFGHDIAASSPYRWWLGLLAGTDHLLSGVPAARAVERAGLYADPLLLLLVIAGASFVVSRIFGYLPALLVAVAAATLYPFATAFLPALPDDRALALAAALASVLPVLAGARAAVAPGPAARRWFLAAGVLGAAGLWVSAAGEAPVLLGLGLGGLLAARAGRGGPPLPWRAWGVGGAAGCLAAYLVEYYPGHLTPWEFHVLHPLFGLAWLGGAELLAVLSARLQGTPPGKGAAGLARAVLGVLGLAALPAAMVATRSLGFLTVEVGAMRLSAAPGSPTAATLWAWLLQNGVTPAAWATLLPLLLLVPAVAFLVLPATPRALRVAVALALGPVLVAAGFACRQINGWNGFDAVLLPLLAATAAAAAALPRPRLVLGVTAGALALLLLPGFVRLWPELPSAGTYALGEADVQGLVERDLSYWLARHVGPAGALVLAPPDTTVALHYYADIRGLGTFGWEDRDGLTAAIRMVSASTPEEAQELFTRRGVTHVVIPSWDPYMDAYARWGQGELDGTFLERLRQWNLPPWLRPVPYLIPTIPGFEGQSVTVLEVVDDQDAATAASRLAEYFVAMNQLDLAANAGQVLRRFPADLGAVLARTEVAVAEGDADETARSLEVLLRRIAGKADRELPWDQRVALAIVLAQTHHLDLAREHLRDDLAAADDDGLRSLSTSALFRLEILRRAVGLEFPDARLRDEAMALLPADLQGRVTK
jgi:hypothetical protein